MYFALILYGLIIILPSLFASRNDRSREEQLSRVNSYEIIVPHRLEGKTKRSINTQNQIGSHIEEAIFSLEAFGTKYFLDVNLNNVLLPSNSTERFYNQDGTPIVRRHRQELHCYYHGSVRHQQDSYVILSTCKGLNGLISVSENDSFWIEPLHGSDNQHLVFRPEDIKDRGRGSSSGNKTACGTGHSDLVKELNSSKLRNKRDVQTDTKYIEVYMVNDYRQFTNLESDVDRVIEKSKEIANHMDWLYKALNTRLVLIGVEVWSQRDLIKVTAISQILVHDFGAWRHKELISKFPNDIAQLISGIAFQGTTIGISNPDSICSHKKSAGVNTDAGNRPVNEIAMIVAHEIAHALGIHHDLKHCAADCPSDTNCIMHESISKKPATVWSQCSRNFWTKSLDNGRGYCLFNQPTVIYEGPICGNEFLEEGEECDCGPAQSCNSKCCNPSNCKLYLNATCATGKCCDDECQFKPGGLTCRETSHDCDLPEYCTGQSSFCPENMYRQNGEPCTQQANAICYEGMCNTRDAQCEKVFGPGAKDAHRLCYEVYNIQGFERGHCGYEYNAGVYTYKPCIKDDIYCGLLRCEGGASRSIYGGTLTTSDATAFVLDSMGKQHTCKAFQLDVHSDTMDLGIVSSGTMCDSHYVCEDKKCLSLSDLDIKPCPNNCSNHGICNNKNHCHCDMGFAPPLCDQEGNGGSIDSGPTPPVNNGASDQTALVVSLVMCLVVLPFLLVLLYFLVRNRTRIYSYYSKRRGQPKGSESSKEATSPKGLTTQQTFVARQSVSPPPPRPPRPIYNPPPSAGRAAAPSGPETHPFIPAQEESVSFSSQWGVQLKPSSQQQRRPLSTAPSWPERQPFIPAQEESMVPSSNRWGVQSHQQKRPLSSAAPLHQKPSPPQRPPPPPLHRPNPPPNRPPRPQSVPGGGSSTQPFRPAPPPPPKTAGK